MAAQSLVMTLIASACLILMVEGSPLSGNNTTAVDVHGEGVCSNKPLLEKLESLKEIVNELKSWKSKGGPSPGDAYAASTSCQQIASSRPNASSGYYWILEESGPARVYCAMEGVSCGGGAWMEVANINMTETNSRCPSGLEKVISPKSLCRKSFFNGGCSSAHFSTHGVPFSKVCGRVIGYQYGYTNAFGFYHYRRSLRIDDFYVTGVSITHSTVPRQHIWTLAAGQGEDVVHFPDSCPCDVPNIGHIPYFIIVNDYFCETGNHNGPPNRSSYYLDDPLWDGKGCGQNSSCCEGKGKPWFFKDLSQPVTSDIEVRVCSGSRNHQDVLIEIISLFVQ